LKMAKKRALVDATLTATAASDIFEQDLEEDDAPQREPPPHRQRKSNGGKAQSRRSAPASDDVEDFGDIPVQFTLEEILARLETAKTKRELDACRAQIKGLQGSDHEAGTKAFQERIAELKQV